MKVSVYFIDNGHAWSHTKKHIPDSTLIHLSIWKWHLLFVSFLLFTRSSWSNYV